MEYMQLQQIDLTPWNMTYKRKDRPSDELGISRLFRGIRTRDYLLHTTI